MAYKVELFNDEFSPFEVLTQQQNILPHVGAQSVFVGYMRDFRADQSVSRMTISHYPPMTQKHLEELAKQALKAYYLHHVYLAHRVGKVYPTSPLVLVATQAAHRANALQATEYLLEALKQTAPFWKKEYRQSGESHWVKNNTENRIQPL